jgi:hypothetical protein
VPSANTSSSCTMFSCATLDDSVTWQQHSSNRQQHKQHQQQPCSILAAHFAQLEKQCAAYCHCNSYACAGGQVTAMLKRIRAGADSCTAASPFAGLSCCSGCPWMAPCCCCCCRCCHQLVADQPTARLAAPYLTTYHIDRHLVAATLHHLEQPQKGT